ncbi:glycerate 2-kinase [Methanocella conradii HZ254]|uniref:Glycerate 2-kinase n=1 Tax=Methanocella conradii (strain DSM 24694 / JCM 17849 / CGMCC 1.5162 / HZ254) TaxID=1041930 RepID=H8I5Z0_METCZ|nr:glycerate kinase [Methanocella conradii]AFD00224.1 glycerate 2-kinase [Methanocella conradii HZ254]
MIIRNAWAIARNDAMRSDALEIVEAGIAAVLPESVIANSIQLNGDVLDIKGHKYDLSRFKRIFVLGGGKASGTMAVEVEKILDGRITAGIVNDRYGVDVKSRAIKINHAGHPIPTEDGVRGVEEMLRMLSKAGPDDLVIFLISGGGSALLPCPAKGISLEDKVRLTDLLLKSGATIAEMNAVRKHVSAIKGGNLVKYSNGAAVVSLIVSDVVGDDAGFIASGPTAPDCTTFSEALRILKKYGIYEKSPQSVINHLENGAKGLVPETPKPGDPIFERVNNVIVASNIIALEAAARKASEKGYRPLILGSCITGESREVGLVLSGIAKECLRSGNPVMPPAAIISGGETTVTVVGSGKGGRNQELVLGFLQNYAQGTTIISIDTDGIDGATDACGAIADATTMKKAQEMGLQISDFLKNNSSYDFFKALGELVYTGPTGTNVSDLRLILIRNEHAAPQQ